MVDITKRVALVFEHPKSSKEEPSYIAVTIPWLLQNGVPLTQKGKPWKFFSTEIIQ
jgi:hypothetical protein